ncbi:hypothetical protein ACFLW1_01615 [Chloroflexota bacterium]
MELSQQGWDEEYFLKEVQKHLNEWPTGKEIDLAEVIKYQKAMPEERKFVKAALKARAEGRTLLGVVTGKPAPQEQVEELQYVEPAVDYFQIVADSLTRNGRFKEAEHGLQQGLEKGKNIINGFPFVIHGLQTSRNVLESVRCPIQSPFPISNSQLTGIMAIAAGVTHISYNVSLVLAQDSRSSLERMILFCQFMDRLIGYLDERDVYISKYPTTLTAAPLPPSISIAWLIIDALMAAEQGVKYFELFYPVNSCVLQDLAALSIAGGLCEDYLARRGHQDVTVFISSATNVSAFPRDASKAIARVLHDAVIGAYAKVVRQHFKTGEEAFGIPSKEATLEAAKAVRMTFDMLRKETYSHGPDFLQEAKMIEQETRAIVDKVLEIGEGDVIRGMVKSIELGVLDIPYCVSSLVAGKCLAIRDAKRAVRYLEHGNLPFNKEIVAYHREKIAERRHQEGKKDWAMIVEDIRAEAEA